MFGVPLIVSARLVLIAALVAALGAPGQLVNAVGSALAIAAVLVEALGFVDLSYRTHGATRTLSRAIAISPLVAIAALALLGLRSDNGGSSETGAWLYGIESCAAVIALWLATPRHHALAVSALATSVLTMIVPRLKLGIVSAILAATGPPGKVLLVFAPMTLVAVLAFFVGREVPPSRVPLARISRTLSRTPFGFVLLAIFTVVELATDGSLESIWLAALGFVLLAIAGYRTRTRSAAAFVPCIAAMIGLVGNFGAIVVAFKQGNDDAARVIALVAMLVVVVAFAIVHARRAHAMIVTALSVVALATSVVVPAASLGFALAADLFTAYAVVVASRDVAAMPEPTVAEVFA
ncbi:MAG TPA: hypothetical protein VGG28_32125 [Kofleriaceae bacterium]|jgi:hypothetical protein